jgi:hypothetical protein
VARNPLRALALLAALALAGRGDAAAQVAHATLAGRTAAPDSTRPRPDSAAARGAAADTAGADSTRLDAATADSLRRAREIEVMRESFAYGGGTRDPFASLLDASLSGPEFSNLELVGVYQDLRSPSNSVVVLREKVTARRYKLRRGDQVGRARLVQIRPRDAVFTISDFGFERQETLSLRKQEVETP